VSRITPVRIGIAIGIAFSVLFGLVYLIVLGEPGAAFYPFAALAFIGGPLVAGLIAVLKTEAHKTSAFLGSGGTVFGTTFILFLITYAVLPQFDRTSVRLPEYCDGFDDSPHPPASLAYTIPTMGTGILLTSDDHTAVVALVDYKNPPFPSTVHVVDKGDNRVLQSLRFGDDTVIATIDEGVVYLYNDKLGYAMDARTGEFEKHFLLIDNYGGLSQSDRPIISRASDGHWHFETTAVISTWNMDGTVRSRPHMTLNGIAFDCFISGETGEVTQL
jgi:hypothetical protein